jgi:hypothetical protein
LQKISTKQLLRFIFLLCGLFSPLFFYAQSKLTNSFSNINTVPKSDTSITKGHKHINYQANVTTTTFESKVATKSNTDLEYLFLAKQMYNYTQQHLGNSGSAVYNLSFNPNHHATQVLGNYVFDDNIKQSKQALFYQTDRPFSEFNYIVGRLQEQGGGILHTQNFTKTNNFALDYYKKTTPGYFSGQRNSHDHFVATFNIDPQKKQRWGTRFAFALNQIRQDENGGIIVPDSALFFPENSFRNAVPVLFEVGQTKSSVNNYYRNNQVSIRNTFNIGKLKTIDSVHYASAFTFVHQLHITGERYRFKDKSPVLDNYSWIDDTTSFTVTDSVYSVTKLATYQNEFGTSFPKLFKNKASIDAFFGVEFQRINQLSLSETVYSNYLSASLNNKISTSLWALDANAQLYVIGKYAGNYHWDAILGKTFNKINLSLRAQQSLQNPSILQTGFETNYYSINTANLSKISATSLGVSMVWNGRIVDSNITTTKSPKFSLNLNSHSIINYTYFDTLAIAKQYNNLLQIVQVEGVSNIYLSKHFKWNLNAQVQIKNANAPINLPLGIGYSSFAYQGAIFKKAMFCVIGVETQYNTSYVTPRYLAQQQQFAFDNSYRQSNAPMLGAFMNVKIKKFYGFIHASELQQPIVGNRFAFANYPIQDFYIRAGFAWQMIN